MNQTVAKLAVDSLIANGIRDLYCVPGVQNDPFFDKVFDRTDVLRPIHARHEQGAVYMALGAALATGKPQAFSIVPGPGFLNGCAALCTAYALNAPLFGVIGQIPSGAIGRGYGLLHEIQGQLDILKSLTKHADRIIEGADAMHQFGNAWRELKSGRPRPVGLEIPVNLWRESASYSLGQLNVAPDRSPTALPEQITKAAALITAAKNPLIVVGSGAQDHSINVRVLAERISAGVVAFRTGHGVLSSVNHLSINMPTGHALWKDCDLVIGLGTRLTTQKMDWGLDKYLKILHIDLDSNVLNQIAPATLGLHADLGSALPALLGELPEQPDRLAWTRQIAETKAALSASITEDLASQIDWLTAIRDALPEDGIFVDELTQIGYVSRFAFPTYGTRRFLSTGYQGTLGWGVATALGAAHARRDVPVVSIAGDGGAMFTISELATAVHHNIPLNIIVMRDDAFGNVRSFQRDNYGARYIASDLTNPDFVKLGESFGVMAGLAKTPDELREELAKAVKNPGPNVIEVPVGEFPSPWDYIMMPKTRGV